MSPLDPEIPPAGEEIHLPGPTLQPLLLAVGLTIRRVGPTPPIIRVAAGGPLGAAVAARWTADPGGDVADLPAHDDHSPGSSRAPPPAPADDPRQAISAA